jgi:hypothetical protein
MKNWKQTALIGMVAIIAFGFAFVACDDGNGNGNGNDAPKDQSQTITVTFGTETPTATVKGHLTDTEWNGVADKIKNALNGRYLYYEEINYDVITTAFVTVFERDVIIVVEKTPSGYSKWKTSTDGKTMYLAFIALDNHLEETIDYLVMYSEAYEVENG